MKGLIKLGIYAAAGYGTYELMRRTGALEKVGNWLTDQVPDDVKTKIRDHVEHAKHDLGERYENARGQVQEQYGNLRSRAQEGYGAARDKAQQLAGSARGQYDHAKEMVTSKLHGGEQQQADGGTQAQQSAPNGADNAHGSEALPAPGSQTITGPGRGADDVTAEVNGGGVHHRVGRGVIHG